MSIKDYIVPKWKHSNPDIRLEAVNNLDSDKIDLLKQIVEKDSNTKVKIAAVEKIMDLEFLESLNNDESDIKIKQAAIGKLNSLYSEKILSISEIDAQLKLINKIEDEKLLSGIACDLDNPDLKVEIVKKINNTIFLCKIAESNCGVKAGKEIIQKISDPDTLKLLSKKASNKKIRKMASEKRDTLLQSIKMQTPEMQTEWELEELCLQLENLIASENWSEANDTLTKVQIEWNKLDPENSHKLKLRFDKSKSIILKQLKNFEQKESIILKIKNLCNEAENLNTLLKENLSIEKINNILKDIDTYKNQWENIANEYELETINFSLIQNLKNRFDIACDNAESTSKNFIKKIEKIELDTNVVDNLLSQFDDLSKKEGDLEQIQKKWNNIKISYDEFIKQIPKNQIYKDRYKKAYEFLNNRIKEKEQKIEQEKNEQKQELEFFINQVKNAINAEKRTGLEKQIQDIQDKWEDSGKLIPEIKNKLEDEFKELCDSFFNKQREFWHNLEWERWANYNLKQELCEMLENIQENDDLPMICSVVRNAQAKWRKIGSVEKEKSDEIWKRFMDICDKIYNRCLERKKQLFNDVIQYTEADIESIHWKNSSKKVKEIQLEWNKIGLLPKSIEKEVRKSFQDTCNKFFENQKLFFNQRDEERKKNLLIKETLCERAESLTDSEDWKETSNILKNLQKRWKDVGPVPKKEGDLLWKRFQKACNNFFNNLEKIKPENLKKKEQLCNEIEEIVNSITEKSNITNTNNKVIDLQKKWKQIGPVDIKFSEEIWERFNSKCNQFYDKKNEIDKKIKEKQFENQKIKTQLVLEAESFARSTDFKETAEKLKFIQKKWHEVGPASRNVERELWEKLNEACDYFFTQRMKYKEELDNKKLANLKEKETICLALEIMAKLTMSGSKIEYNKFVPVAEQLSLAMNYKDEVIISGDKKASWEKVQKKIKQIKTKWDQIGPISDLYDKTLFKRYNKALDLFSYPSQNS